MENARFTAADAFEAFEDGEPIMVESNAAHRICTHHGTNLDAYVIETGTPASQGQYEASALLTWLGY